jgi:uncharacterized membrane protein
MPAYDSAELAKLADQMLARAKWTSLTFSALGVVLTLSANEVLSRAFGDYDIIAYIAAGLISGAFGDQVANSLRLQAQTALCQSKIEENTRRT